MDSHVKNLQDNRNFERKMIAEGIVLNYLKDQNKPMSDIAIASEFDLNTQLVRAELGRLVETGQARVKPSPAQGCDSCGLDYEAISNE